MKTLTDVLESSMTSLYESIFDTFDDEGNVTTDSSELIKQEIIDWINENCRDCKIIFDDKKTEDGKYIVNCDNVYIFNKNITSLTNGQFIWGNITGTFSCFGCKQLKSLKGAPKYVGEWFDCHECDNLISLEGAPERVGDWFDCNSCKQLKSLKGAPKRVEGIFDCSWCISLKSLKGAPEIVKSTFDCGDCEKLTSLKGAPKRVEGNFFCTNCGDNFSKEYVKKVSDVKGEIIC